jgi:uncharacterized protein YndB with AHSA1/START domain
MRVAERVAMVAPPDKVWEAVTDWEGQRTWVLLTTVTVDEGEPGVGQRLTAVTGIGPLAFADHMEVTHWEPPHRVDVRHLGRVVRGTGTFSFEPVPGGTRFTWVEDLEPPFGVPGRVAFALARPAMELMLRFSLRRLTHRLEAAARARLGGAAR